MRAVSPFTKDPAAYRFAGGPGEAETLFGSPAPQLPTKARDEERECYFVNFQPQLRMFTRRFVEVLLGQIGLPGGSKGDAERAQSEYEAALARILRSVRLADRRRGLPNLFWLAHSRDIAVFLKELEGRNPAVRKAKYSLHPLLCSFYRRLELDSRKADTAEEALLVAGASGGLIESIIEDGLAFTETGMSDLDITLYLSNNKRHRLPPDVFFEIQSVVVHEAERRVRDGDRVLLSRVARHLPGLPKEAYLKPAGLLKIALSSAVLPSLLGDVWSVGARLAAAPVIKAEVERRRGAELVDSFLDFVSALKRFDLISHVRQDIVLLGSGGERDLEDKASRGLRFYDFGESARVLNNAVNAAVLFLDLRGFTQTSEGQISERDLTQELYAVFDSFVPIVARFGGTIDKFIGDGIMVTYGTDHADVLAPLNALRTAVLCQEALRKLRDAGSTYFRMGIAVHCGRVYLARFLAGQDEVHPTVIGRNVNLAGRLSSAARKPIDEDDAGGTEPVPPQRPSELNVAVDGDGTLFNEGIAISRDTLVQLENHLPLVHGDGVMEFDDEATRRRMLFRYSGDAKFKGVHSSLPVYDVDYEQLF